MIPCGEPAVHRLLGLHDENRALQTLQALRRRARPQTREGVRRYGARQPKSMHSKDRRHLDSFLVFAAGGEALVGPAGFEPATKGL